MTSKMNMIVKAITVKVTGIGKAHAMLEKYLLAAERKLLAPFSLDPAGWEKTDVLFLVACADNQDTWAEFQKGIDFARQQNMLVFPIWISDEQPEKTDNILVVKPKNFSGNMELFAYISESIQSIYTVLSQPGPIDVDLETVRSLFKDPGRLLFHYYEYQAKQGKYSATDKALQWLAAQGVAPHSGKIVLLNITGSEDNLSMFEVSELSDMIHDGIGNNDSEISWLAASDNALADTIHVTMWVKS